MFKKIGSLFAAIVFLMTLIIIPTGIVEADALRTDFHTKPAATTDGQYTLTINANGDGTTIPAPGVYSYNLGTIVNLTAIPTRGNEFVNWNGTAADINSPSTTITINGNTTITAYFIPLATGSRIAYIASAINGPPGIYIMNSDGTNPTRISYSNDYISDPVLSPDGKMIAFVAATASSSHQLYVMNSDGSQITQLTNNSSATSFGGGGLSWSPDGTSIAFCLQGNNYSEIYTIKVTGIQLTRLTNNAFEDIDPSWSPDGLKIAYLTNQDSTAQSVHQLRIMNTDGTNSVVVPCGMTENIQSVSWSPDGGKFVIATDPSFNLYTVNINGTGLTLVTTGGCWPRWSPDSRQLVYQNSLTLSDIYSIKTDGTNKIRLTNAAGPETQPSWGTGNWIQLAIITKDPSYLTATSERLSSSITSIDSPNRIKASFLIGTSPGNYSWETTKQAVISTGDFYRDVTGFTTGVTYYYVAKAYGNGLSFGVEKSFTAGTFAPTIKTNIAKNVSVNSASIGGTLLSKGLSNVISVHIEYGTTSNYGTSTTIQQLDTTGDFTVSISGLIPGTLYHYRTVADGGVNGTNIGNDMTFITLNIPADSKIAYMKYANNNYDIYVMNGDGTNQTQLTNNSADDINPVLSPDGTKIAFASKRNGNWEIYVINTNGSGETRLTNDATLDCSNPVWSPDGSKIIYVSAAANMTGGKTSLCVINVDGTQKTLLLNQYFTGSPNWSPDGTKIAYISRGADSANELFVMNQDGTNQQQLTTNTTNAHGAGNPVWSPDSAKIAFTWLRNDYLPSMNLSQIFVVNSDGTNFIRVASSQTQDLTQPAWCPDNTKIACTSVSSASNNIYVVSADGSGANWGVLGCTNPTWSPDGTKLALSTINGIFTIHADGTNLTGLTTSSYLFFGVSWGKYIPNPKLNFSGYTSPITAGTAGTFTVTAQNAAGNTVTGYTGTVHFTSSDSQAVLPANYTFVTGDNGTHIFSATLKTAGTQSITVTDTVTNTITGTQTGITVNAAAASQIRVETAANGSGVILTAQNVSAGSTVTSYSVTRDQYGNFVANAAGTWSLLNKTGGVADSDLIPASDNKSAVFTAHAAGTASIHVISGTLTSTDSGVLTVVVGGVSKFGVSGYTSPATAGTQASFTVTAQNAAGSTVTSYTGTVHFTSSDTQAVLPANYTFVSGDNGTHTFSATLKTAGTRSITATDTVTSSVTGVQNNIIVNPGTANQIRVETAANGSGGILSAQTINIGSSITGYAVTRDQFGNFVANAPADSWSLTGITGGVVSGDLVAAGDKKSALFTGHGAGSAAIHVTYGSLTSNDSGLITVAQPPAPPPPPPPPSGGGGGGGGGPSTPPSVAGVTNLANVVDAKGVFSLEVDAWSDNKKVVLVIGGNTTATAATGTTLTQISLLHADTVPAFTTGANAIGLAYDFQPAGITFNPAVIVRFNYDPKLIPDGVDENSLQIAYYDSTANVWVPLPSTIDINNKFITAPISHFSTYAVTYGVKMPAPVKTTTTAPVIITTPLLITTPTTTMPVVTTTTSLTTVAPVTTSTTTTAPADISVTTQTATVISTNVAPLSANSLLNTMPEQTTPQVRTSPSPASKVIVPVWLFVIIGLAVLTGCMIIALRFSRRRG